ncbi:MAG: hypothetical protein RSD54_08440 [Ruthenibacterium sp.]
MRLPLFKFEENPSVAAATQKEIQPKPMRKLIVLLAVLIGCNLAALTFVLAQRRDAAFSPAAQGSLLSNDVEKPQTADKKISDDMQFIAINEAPHFDGLHGEGDLRIEIAKECHYAYRVTYSLAATQEQILQTGLIKPGEYVLKKPLDVTLEAGVYDVIAIFSAYDTATGDLAGKAAQTMTFYIV